MRPLIKRGLTRTNTPDTAGRLREEAAGGGATRGAHAAAVRGCHQRAPGPPGAPGPAEEGPRREAAAAATSRVNAKEGRRNVNMVKERTKRGKQAASRHAAFLFLKYTSHSQKSVAVVGPLHYASLVPTKEGALCLFCFSWARFCRHGLVCLSIGLARSLAPSWNLMYPCPSPPVTTTYDYSNRGILILIEKITTAAAAAGPGPGRGLSGARCRS